MCCYIILFSYVLSEAIQIHTTCDASPIYRRLTIRHATQALWDYIDERRRRQLEQRSIECELPVTHLEAVLVIAEPIFLCNHDATPHGSPHVSHRAFSFTGSTTTLCSGLAKGMPSIDALGEAGKPRFIHVLRTLMSTPPWLCIRPRRCHHILRD